VHAIEELFETDEVLDVVCLGKRARDSNVPKKSKKIIRGNYFFFFKITLSGLSVLCAQ